MAGRSTLEPENQKENKRNPPLASRRAEWRQSMSSRLTILVRGEVFQRVFHADFTHAAAQDQFQLPALRAGFIFILFGTEALRPVPGTFDDRRQVAPLTGAERRKGFPPTQSLRNNPSGRIAVTDAA